MKWPGLLTQSACVSRKFSAILSVSVNDYLHGGGPGTTDQPLEIQYVEFEGGAIPYLKWFRKQTAVVKTEVDARLIQVRKRNFGDHRKLPRGVTELRFEFCQALRVYGGEWKGHFFVLLHGGFKPTQQADIKEATRLWVEFTKAAGKKRK